MTLPPDRGPELMSLSRGTSGFTDLLKRTLLSPGENVTALLVPPCRPREGLFTDLALRFTASLEGPIHASRIDEQLGRECPVSL